jgi:cbb3-type cytochrome oxidase subunit 3
VKPLIWIGSFLAGWWWYGYRHDRKQPNVES